MPFVKMTLVCLAFGMLLSVTFAAPPAAPASRVVMLLRDGSNIGGELLEATPAGVTIRPSPESPPVTKPWSTIKALGDGMTYASIVTQWRETRSELLCDACTGTGATTFPMCGGKAIDPASAVISTTCIGQLIVMEDGMPTNVGICPRCHGTSVIDDPACHGTGKQSCATCKDGTVACAPCHGTELKSPMTQPIEKEAP